MDWMEIIIGIGVAIVAMLMVLLGIVMWIVVVLLRLAIWIGVLVLAIYIALKILGVEVGV